MSILNEELLKALADLISEGTPEVPDIEEIKILSKASQTTREEKARNKELNIINAKIRGRASTGYFDLGEAVFIGYSANIDALEEAGYILTPTESTPYSYEISWGEKEETNTEPSEGEEEEEGESENTNEGNEGTI